MSPLATSKPDNPQITERFEMYVANMELCDAYTELNEPSVQLERFKQQMALNDPGHMLNEDYVHALEYGFPPTGGWSLGVDRLAMLLTNNTDIREVIAFNK